VNRFEFKGFFGCSASRATTVKHLSNNTSTQGVATSSQKPTTIEEVDSTADEMDLSG